MARIVSEPPDPRKRRSGRAECTDCGTVYDFGPNDVHWTPGFLDVGEAYLYLTCPNERCQSQAILIDYRYLGPLWRFLSGPRNVKLVPVGP